MELDLLLLARARQCEVCGQFYIYEYYGAKAGYSAAVAAEPCDHKPRNDEEEDDA